MSLEEKSKLVTTELQSILQPDNKQKILNSIYRSDIN